MNAILATIPLLDVFARTILSQLDPQPQASCGAGSDQGRDAPEQHVECEEGDVACNITKSHIGANPDCQRSRESGGDSERQDDGSAVDYELDNECCSDWR
jgi:hypothetical protein